MALSKDEQEIGLFENLENVLFTGEMGWTGYEKSPSVLFILRLYIDFVYINIIYIYIHIYIYICIYIDLDSKIVTKILMSFKI